MHETKDHEYFMKRCFALARMGHGHVRTNPMVGCVIVHQGDIIAEGYHRAYGQWHAERDAIMRMPQSSQSLLAESTLYVNLEPCNHHGKTPPCVDIIREKSIPHVVVAMTDPNPQMKGKSLDSLQQAGIKVTEKILQAKAQWLNRAFIINQQKKIPYVILKWAQSKDAYIGRPQESIWLTNSLSKFQVHKWRSEIDAIMIGSETAIIDNPALTTRLYPGPSPIRVVVDRRGRLTSQQRLLSDEYPTLIYGKAPKSPLPNHKTAVSIPEDSPHQLSWILQDLYSRGIGTLMVEGGAKLLSAFIGQSLWHEARIFRTEKSLQKGIKAPSIEGQCKRKITLGNNTLHYLHPPKLERLLSC